MEGKARRILDGVRVLDLTSVIFGTYATQMLGDLGADVVKIEAPSGPDNNHQGGDIMRWAGPAPAGGAAGMGPLFLAFNRNKRSVCLDLKSPAGRAALLTLAEKADIFASNIRMAALIRLGLGYDTLRAARGDIVYVHAAGYGSEGPDGGKAAYDEMMQGAAGLADLYCRAHGGDEPRYLPMLAADKTSALFMVYAALAALYQRATTGEGQFVEVPMLECLTHFNMSETLYGHIHDPPTGDYGYHRILNPHRRPYRTRDGWIGVAPYTDRNWRDFFALAGREREFAEDARFNSYGPRIRNIAALYAMVESITLTRTTEEWLPLLAARSIPATRINRLDTIMDDPHLAAQGFFARRHHPSEGDIVDMAHPVRFSAASTATRRLAPRLGEHTAEVFTEWDVTPPETGAA